MSRRRPLDMDEDDDDMDTDDLPRPTTRRRHSVTIQDRIINAVVDEDMELLRSLEDDIRQRHLLLNIGVLSAASRFSAEVLEWLFSLTGLTYTPKMIGDLVTDALNQIDH